MDMAQLACAGAQWLLGVLQQVGLARAVVVGLLMCSFDRSPCRQSGALVCARQCAKLRGQGAG